MIRQTGSNVEDDEAQDVESAAAGRARRCTPTGGGNPISQSADRTERQSVSGKVSSNALPVSRLLRLCEYTHYLCLASFACVSILTTCVSPPSPV
ncbi:hypothetical protein BaRGS_00039322 [Batillaria attramentaria]|uniref:Uncharacterized protein n=1 Tax=Batillaria attramentaria TaxID=370345 RepID=A0ABD0J3L2_9CAEN